MTLVYVLAATGLISLGGLLGIIFFWTKKKTLNRWLQIMVALSAGVLLGVTFFDLFPEAVHMLPADEVFSLFLVFFVALFLVEKLINWHHCHKPDCDIHSFGYMNLIGDAIHNFVDGMLIAAAFMVDPTLGVTTTIAVALHEIPHEISDFGVLLYAGFSKTKALIMNFAIALFAVLGGVFGVVAASLVPGIEPYMLVLAAASFFYIAASDLMPEMRKVTSTKQLVGRFSVLLVGIALMYGLSITFGHSHGVGDHDNDHGHSHEEDHHDEEEHEHDEDHHDDDHDDDHHEDHHDEDDDHHEEDDHHDD